MPAANQPPLAAADRPIRTSWRHPVSPCYARFEGLARVRLASKWHRDEASADSQVSCDLRADAVPW